MVLNTMGLLQFHVQYNSTAEKYNFRELVRPADSRYSNIHLTRTVNLVPTMNFEDACRWRVLFTSMPAIRLLHFDDIGCDLSAK